VACSCALAADGAAWCWGSWGDSSGGKTSAVPTPAAQGLTFTDISLADQYTCGLTAAGDVYCCGYYDPDGDDDVEGTWLGPTKIQLDWSWGPLSASSISAGGNATCAIRSSGQVFCWRFPQAPTHVRGDGVSRRTGGGTREPGRHPPRLSRAATAACPRSGCYGTVLVP
jgi:hypothetical protein